VQFLTPFIDDTNRAAHIFRVLCKLARNPGSVSVRAFQIEEMSPIVVYERAARTCYMKEIAFHAKTLQTTDSRNPLSRTSKLRPAVGTENICHHQFPRPTKRRASFASLTHEE